MSTRRVREVAETVRRHPSRVSGDAPIIRFEPATRILKRIYRDRSGSVMVEFALCFVVLMLFTIGLIEFCFALYARNYVSYAARTWARYAIVRGSSCTGMTDCGITGAQIQTDMRGSAAPGIITNNLTATATWFSASSSQPTTWTSCGTTQCNAPGNAVEVQVTYLFPLSIPFWKKETLTITSASQMVISN